MKLGLISLGCAKNLIDSELFLGLAKKYNLEITNKIKDADIIVVNTCGFILPAKEESLNTIFEVLEYQKHNKTIIVMGCLVERYLNDLKQEIPEVDYFIPISQYDELDVVFNSITKSNVSHKLDYKERLLSTPKGTAYLRIGDGCNNRCHYCAIPLIRGNYRSRLKQDIIEEAKMLAEKDVKEIVLIAQDTTTYGSDLGNTNLVDLLKSIKELNLFKFIRVLYLYPDEITDELIDLMTMDNENDSSYIVPYFDIPIQHSETRLLKHMNRRGTKEDIELIFNKIKQKNKDAILRTTLITGYPSETEEEFDAMLKFVNKHSINHLGCFAYSEEEGTIGAGLPFQINEKVRADRANAIMQLQQEKSLQLNKQRIGNEYFALVEKYDPTENIYQARTYAEAPEGDDGYVLIKNENLVLGEIIKLKIINASYYDLEAIVIKKEEN